MYSRLLCHFFFFNDTATTEIYTLSLHDALPISRPSPWTPRTCCTCSTRAGRPRDRKSTRLNSSHVSISYAVFCLKKKQIQKSAFLTQKEKTLIESMAPQVVTI